MSDSKTPHRCANPDCERPTHLRCSGCSRVWYCSPRCQKDVWSLHIFECKVTKPIKTSYYLARAARQDIFPDDNQTLEDYGFTRAITNTQKSNLIGLYIGLFAALNVDPKDVHSWRTKGLLVEKIKAAYEQLPPGARGGYYPWFLRNQHILNPSLPLPVTTKNTVEDTVIRAWRFTGGSVTDTLDTIKAKYAQMTNTTRQCHLLYEQLFFDPMNPPRLYMESWVRFGFCACRDTHSEGALSGLYHQLIECCTFNEFVAAFESNTLLKLMRAKGLLYNWDPTPDMEDVLGSDMLKSVWFLKQSIEMFKAGSSPPYFRKNLSIQVDYGFVNCKDEEELQDLKALYQQVLDMPHISPLDLHDACIRGTLFDFVDRHVMMKEEKVRAQLKRLLKNPYTLLDI